jgi:hypothetical protein
MPTVQAGVMNQSDLPYEKSLRNRANYATRNWNKSQQEVDSLLLNQSRLIEEQKQFQEQLSDSEHLQTKLIAKLTTSEQQESKMVKVLSARTKRLSSALQDEKEKSKKQKMRLKEEMAEVVSVSKDTLQVTTKILRAKCKDTKDTLLQKHQLEVSSILNEQAKIVTSVKDKAKDTVKTIKRKSEDSLVRSRRASKASRIKLKVSKVCLYYNVLLQV